MCIKIRTAFIVRVFITEQKLLLRKILLLWLSPPQRFPFSCEFLEFSVFSVLLYQEPLTIVFVGGSEIEKKIEGNLCQLSVVIWLKLTFSDYSPQTQSSAVPDTKMRRNRKTQGIHGKWKPLRRKASEIEKPMPTFCRNLP
jgi:hypothetical protein